MILSESAAALTGSVVCGALVLLVALAHVIFPPFAEAFLAVLASVYPGYDVGGGWGSAVLAATYAAVDGAIVGFLIAWTYNRLGTS